MESILNQDPAFSPSLATIWWLPPGKEPRLCTGSKSSLPLFLPPPGRLGFLFFLFLLFFLLFVPHGHYNCNFLFLVGHPCRRVLSGAASCPPTAKAEVPAGREIMVFFSLSTPVIGHFFPNHDHDKVPLAHYSLSLFLQNLSFF